MNYQEFRDQWHEALRAAHLHIPYPIGPTERINLRDMSRSYETALFGGVQANCEPFHVVAVIEWEWDATLAARYTTTEEDMLMQIFGDFGIHEDDTVPPWLRMDVRLTASIPYAAVFPMPPLDRWQRWVRQASAELQVILPTHFEEDGTICAYSDPIQATVKLLEDGRLNLESVTIKAWQAVELPRQWDAPEKRDPYPDEALLNFANRIARARKVMENNLARLVEDKA